MTIYTRTETIEAMRWCEHGCETARNDPADCNDAAKIIRWINANGGEARYEPVGLTENGFEHGIIGGIIAVRTPNGWAYMAPGDVAVITDKWFRNPVYNGLMQLDRVGVVPVQLRGFRVVSAAVWSSQGWTVKP